MISTEGGKVALGTVDEDNEYLLRVINIFELTALSLCSRYYSNESISFFTVNPQPPRLKLLLHFGARRSQLVAAAAAAGAAAVQKTV